MTPITIFVNESNDWVTNWHGHDHAVRFNPTDQSSFVTLGLVGLQAVRFDLSPQGIIMGVFDQRTDLPISQVTLPVNHSLYRELNIGKPV